MAYWRIYHPEWQAHQPDGVRWAEVVPMGEVTPPADDDPGPVKPEPVEPEPVPVYYAVRPGDSWWRISFNHGMTVNELQMLNLEAASRTLHPGQQLIVGYQDNSPSNNS